MTTPTTFIIGGACLATAGLAIGSIAQLRASRSEERGPLLVFAICMAGVSGWLMWVFIDTLR